MRSSMIRPPMPSYAASAGARAGREEHGIDLKTGTQLGNLRPLLGSFRLPLSSSEAAPLTADQFAELQNTHPRLLHEHPQHSCRIHVIRIDGAMLSHTARLELPGLPSMPLRRNPVFPREAQSW